MGYVNVCVFTHLYMHTFILRPIFKNMFEPVARGQGQFYFPSFAFTNI